MGGGCWALQRRSLSFLEFGRMALRKTPNPCQSSLWTAAEEALTPRSQQIGFTKVDFTGHFM